MKLLIFLCESHKNATKFVISHKIPPKFSGDGAPDTTHSAPMLPQLRSFGAASTLSATWSWHISVLSIGGARGRSRGDEGDASPHQHIAIFCTRKLLPIYEPQYTVETRYIVMIMCIYQASGCVTVSCD